MEEAQQTISKYKIVWLHTIQNTDQIPEENIFCSCCEEVDFTKNNEIVLCDGCDVAVHQECYHIINLEDKWYCQRCLAVIDNPAIDIKCTMCPENYHILESVQINEQPLWAHSSCLKWNYNLSLNNNSQNSYSCTNDYNTGFKCRYCESSMGFQMQCNFVGCQDAFHIGCLKVRGGIQTSAAMDCLFDLIKPHLKIQDKRLLCCSEHHEELELAEDKKQLFQESISINQLEFLDLKKSRHEQYYQYNQNKKILSDKNIKQKQKNYEDTLFDDFIQLKQIKSAKLQINDKRVRQQFKDYMSKKLSEQLCKLRDDFLKVNNNGTSPDEDTYISIDIQLCKKLFDKVVDINNLEEFDKYLVSYFIFNNMIRRPSCPEFYIRDDNQNYNFWRKVLDEIGLRNGEQLNIFINALRLKKMSIVSRNNERLQQEQDLLQQFENRTSDMIE